MAGKYSPVSSLAHQLVVGLGKENQFIFLQFQPNTRPSTLPVTQVLVNKGELGGRSL